MLRLGKVSLIVLLYWFVGIEASAEGDKPQKDIFVSDYESTIFKQLNTGESGNLLRLFLAPNTSMTPEKEDAIQKDLTKLLSKLKRKKASFRSERAFLQYLFFHVHHKYLKNYNRQADMYALFDNGKYNCVTGTALYAYLLDQLKISYRIIEMEYHVTLLVKTNGGEALFESTDPINGYEPNEQKLRQRIAEMKEGKLSENLTQGKRKDYFDFNHDVYNTVTLKQLAGLQYYNLAANQFNAQQIELAEASIEKGKQLYQSTRFTKFAQFLVANR